MKTVHLYISGALMALAIFAFGSKSAEGGLILAEPAISNFMAAPGNAQVVLSWISPPSAAGYNVKLGTTAAGRLTVIATNISNPGLTVTNLKNGTAYFFAVSSDSDGFESGDTVRLRAVPSAPVPDLLPAGAKLEKLASGFTVTFGGIEGPVWNPSGGHLIFSYNQGNQLLRWTPGSGISIFRQSDQPNGSTLDLQGRLITCEQSTRIVARTEIDGSVTPLVTEYKGKKFNQPNDVVVKSDGTVWFTDPAYFPPQTQPGNYVYRFDPTNGNATVTPVATKLGHPNGLCFSPDETKLFVADTDGEIRVFDVLSDNSLTNSRVFISQGADGIRATPDGRFFLCNGSVKIFGMDGQPLGQLAVPENAANLCFGGTNREMLFITAQTSLYGITRMPDLIVTAINRFPTNPTSGQSVNFSAVIKNQGTVSTLKDVPIRVAFSIDGETNVVWSEFAGSLSPDASVILTAIGGERTHTWTATAGIHSVKATVDSLNGHRESNETNNVLALNLKVAAPAPDSDGDGLDDFGEATAGTDSTDAASVLKILAAERLADDRLALTWSSVPGKTYRVSREAVLGSLESAEFSEPMTATTITTSWTNNLSFTRLVQFLRIHVD